MVMLAQNLVHGMYRLHLGGMGEHLTAVHITDSEDRET